MLPMRYYLKFLCISADVLFVSYLSSATAVTTEASPEVTELSPTDGECSEDASECEIDGYVEILQTGHCVRMVEEKKDFNASQSYCREHDGAKLVRLEEKYVDLFVTHLLSLTKEDKYWIGLTSFDEPGVFKWLGESHEAFWFNWNMLNGPDTSQGNCAAKISKLGTWVQLPCHENASFICERTNPREPGYPTVEVTYDMDADVGFVGKAVNITCWSYVPAESSVNPVISTVLGSVVTQAKYSNYFMWQENRLTRVGHQCLTLSNASIEFNELTKELNNAEINCCWTRHDNRSRCAPRMSLEILYMPLPPTLDIHIDGEPPTLVEGETINATCSGFVGENGHLIWFLSSQGVTTKWKIELNGTTYFRGETDEEWLRVDGDSFLNTTTESVSVHYPTLGAMINSTFTRLATMDLNGSRLSCRTYMPGHDEVNTPDKVKAIPMILVIEYEVSESHSNGHVFKKDFEDGHFWQFLMLFLIPLIGGICLATTAMACPRQRSMRRGNHRHLSPAGRGGRDRGGRGKLKVGGRIRQVEPSTSKSPRLMAYPEYDKYPDDYDITMSEA